MKSLIRGILIRARLKPLMLLSKKHSKKRRPPPRAVAGHGNSKEYVIANGDDKRRNDVLGLNYFCDVKAYLTLYGYSSILYIKVTLH